MGDGSVGVVVLAAGGSARMGEPKQFLPFRGRSLLRHAAETAVTVGCGPVVVVLGAAADRLGPELAGLPVRAVCNPDWEAGIGSSLRIGIRSVATEEVDAVVVLLADQPLAGPEVIARLVERFRADRPAVVAAEYAGTLGVPAVFRRDLFPRLLELGDREGAKRVISDAGLEAARVPFPDGAFDIDTPLDYARLRISERTGG